MNEILKEDDCLRVIDQLIKLLHLSYDELMVFERAFMESYQRTSRPVAEVVKGEIDCQKGLLKILIYISEISRQQGEQHSEEAGDIRQPLQPC